MPAAWSFPSLSTQDSQPYVIIGTTIALYTSAFALLLSSLLSNIVFCNGGVLLLKGFKGSLIHGCSSVIRAGQFWLLPWNFPYFTTCLYQDSSTTSGLHPASFPQCFRSTTSFNQEWHHRHTLPWRWHSIGTRHTACEYGGTKHQEHSVASTFCLSGFCYSSYWPCPPHCSTPVPRLSTP